MAESTFSSKSHSREERHHVDPPRLWIGTIAGSIIIHAIAFFMLRSLLFANKAAANVGQAEIPIELVAIANSPQTTPTTKTSSSPQTIAPSPLQRKVANPKLTTTSSEITPPQPQLPETAKSQPRVVVTPTPQKIVEKATEKQKLSDKAKKQQEVETASKQPDLLSKDKSEENIPSQGDTVTKPVDTVEVETTPDNLDNTTESQISAGETESVTDNSAIAGIIATVGAYRLTDTSRDIPDKLAQPRQNSISVASEEIKPLGINVERVVQVEVVVLIRPTGEASVVGSPRILQGSISVDAAQVLATQIVQKMQFEPTYMGSSPVAQAYYLPLTISPSAK